MGTVHPFLEAGPSFRTRKNPGPTEPSQFGATVGVGGEFQLQRFRVTSTIRYTRWQYDGPFPHYPTKRDQLELLTGISYAASPASWKIHGRKFRFGAVGGTPMTGGLESRVRGVPALSEEQGYIAGLLFELDLTPRLSVEVNGLYRPLRGFRVTDFEGTTFRDPFTVLTWEFPALAKYGFRPSPRWRPVIEAGPSFRKSGNLNGYAPSRYGLTVGSGIETNARGVKFGSVLRFTRWAPDTDGFVRTGPNQAELLVGISF